MTSRVLENLSSPAGFQARVESLATAKAELLEEPDQGGESLPAGSISVVIVIRPTQPQPILAGPLDAGRPIAVHPIFPLGREETVACPVAADLGDGRR